MNDFVYPLAFLTNRNKLFIKSDKDLSADGSPRYMVNAGATYSYITCSKYYKPIYDKKELNRLIKDEKNN